MRNLKILLQNQLKNKDLQFEIQHDKQNLLNIDEETDEINKEVDETKKTEMSII